MENILDKFISSGNVEPNEQGMGFYQFFGNLGLQLYDWTSVRFAFDRNGLEVFLTLTDSTFYGEKKPRIKSF